MQEQATSSKPFEGDFDESFYQEQIQLIEADIQFYKEKAEQEYINAELDYSSMRELTVQDSDGKTVSLQLLNDERQLIKRRIGLIAGSKDSINVEPVTPDDKEFSEYIQAFLDYELGKNRFNRIKQKIVKECLKIGIGYVSSFYDPRLLNKKYGSIGLITQEVLSYDEVILDKNSRDNMDYESSTFRNRETRIERLPLAELKRLAEKSPYIPDPDMVTSHNLTESDDTNENGEIQDEDYGYLYTHEFRRKETVVFNEEGDLVSASDDEEGSFDAWVYYYMQLINNDIQLIITPITQSPINKFMIDVLQYEILSDSPYSFGYMYDTKEERQLLSEAHTAEMLAIKGSVKETIFFTGTLTKAQAKYISDNLHRSMAHSLPPGTLVNVIGGNKVSPVYDQLIQRLINRKEEKGGEYPLQAGKQSYSTETGKLANILNSRSDLSKIEDITNVEIALSSAIETFLTLAQKNYSMRMIIPRLADDGSDEVKEYFELNGSNDMLIDKGMFDINVKIEMNSDIKKAENAQLATANADILAPEDRLEMQGVPQPKIKVINYYKSQGIQEIANFINENEDGMELWEMFQSQVESVKVLKQNADAELDSNSVDQSKA